MSNIRLIYFAWFVISVLLSLENAGYKALQNVQLRDRYVSVGTYIKQDTSFNVSTLIEKHC